MTGGGRGARGWLSLLLSLALSAGATAWFLSMPFYLQDLVERSDRTQEGVTVSGDVVEARETGVLGYHDAPGPWSFRVALDEPVAGRSETTAFVADSRAMPTGDRLTVVVDPQDPAYAEVPGAPYVTEDGPHDIYWGFAAASVAFGVLVLTNAMRDARSRTRDRGTRSHDH